MPYSYVQTLTSLSHTNTHSCVELVELGMSSHAECNTAALRPKLDKLPLLGNSFYTFVVSLQTRAYVELCVFVVKCFCQLVEKLRLYIFLNIPTRKSTVCI